MTVTPGATPRRQRPPERLLPPLWPSEDLVAADTPVPLNALHAQASTRHSTPLDVIDELGNSPQGSILKFSVQCAAKKLPARCEHRGTPAFGSILLDPPLASLPIIGPVPPLIRVAVAARPKQYTVISHLGFQSVTLPKARPAPQSQILGNRYPAILLRDSRPPPVLTLPLDGCIVKYVETTSVSVFGPTGLLGSLTVRVQHLLRQNSRNPGEHKEATAIHRRASATPRYSLYPSLYPHPSYQVASGVLRPAAPSIRSHNLYAHPSYQVAAPKRRSDAFNSKELSP